MMRQEDATQVAQERRPTGEPTGQVCFSFFLQTRLDDPDLFSLMLDLLATIHADQIICALPCRQYVVDKFSRGLVEEHGVVVSVVLPDTSEFEIAVKAWAIRAAKYLGEELRFIAQEVSTISAPASQRSDTCQLGFDGW